MKWRKSAAVTERAWLDQLGKQLVSRYSAPQVREILEDYREQFQAGTDRGKSEEEISRALGSPQEAAARLLEESPPHGDLLHNLLWGALLVICLLFFRFFVLMGITRHMSYLCGAIGIPAIAGVLLTLLRGQSRAELERRFPPEHAASPAALFGPPLALAALFEITLQALVVNAGWIADTLNLPYVGLLVQLICFGMAGIGVLLALWWIFRSVTRSIACFPGAIHAFGLGVASIVSLLPFISIEAAAGPRELARELPLAMLPYLSGLVTVLLFRRWIAAQFPACFRLRGGGRQAWLDQLGKKLLRWFPAAQVREILEDYQEQFELGAERGKSEEALVEELGRPETVARDLLAAESPLLRQVVRQRTLLWIIPLLPAVYGLTGMLYCYAVGPRWAGIPDLEPVFLALGSLAMFALLHGRGRAELEALFPPERGKPPVLLFLLPLADAAVAAAGFCYILTHTPAGEPPVVAFMDWSWGALIICYTEPTTLIMGALLVWTLSRSAARSIRYFPAAVLSAGAMASVLNFAYFFEGYLNTGFFSEIAETVLWALTPGLTCLVLAIGFGAAIAVWGARAKEG